MRSDRKDTAVILAVLAAVFYAVNVPFSKQLMERIPPTFMASLLYLGAGVGIGILYGFNRKKEDRSERLSKQDLPYTAAMIVLDILAPIFLMVGVKLGTASNASLLSNFEIVATSLIALVLFRERISRRLWGAIALITASCLILSFEGAGSFDFSVGSLFVVLATCCWGFENNCTRKISGKSTFEIVLLKGIFSGGGAFAIACLIGEDLPPLKDAALAMLLGFLSYGLSIFLYVRAQRTIGAAKTSAFYAVAPFISGALSFLIHDEKLSLSYGIALLVMILGTGLVIRDTLDSSGTDSLN